MLDALNNYRVGVDPTPNTPGNSIAGGGGGGVSLDLAPSTAPGDPTQAALTYPSGGGTLFQWDVDSQTWV